MWYGLTWEGQKSSHAVCYTPKNKGATNGSSRWFNGRTVFGSQRTIFLPFYKESFFTVKKLLWNRKILWMFSSWTIEPKMVLRRHCLAPLFLRVYKYMVMFMTSSFDYIRLYIMKHVNIIKHWNAEDNWLKILSLLWYYNGVCSASRSCSHSLALLDIWSCFCLRCVKHTALDKTQIECVFMQL